MASSSARPPRWLALVAVACLIVLLRQRRRGSDAGAAPATGLLPSWPPLEPAAPATATPSATPSAAASAAPSAPAAAVTYRSPVDGACPDGYPIKASSSGIYHLPGGRSYERTRPQRCYADPLHAEADGYRRAKP